MMMTINELEPVFFNDAVSFPCPSTNPASWMNLTSFEAPKDDSGFAYCASCDECSDFKPVAMNELYERWQCQNCGALGKKLVISDYGYQLQGYLLQGSEFDEGLVQMYDGTWK